MNNDEYKNEIINKKVEIFINNFHIFNNKRNNKT